MTSSIKPEVRNVSLRRQRRTEPRPQVICAKNSVKIGRVVPNRQIADRRTHTHRDRHAHHNTPLPYWGRSKNWEPRNESRHCRPCEGDDDDSHESLNTRCWRGVKVNRLRRRRRRRRALHAARIHSFVHSAGSI